MKYRSLNQVARQSAMLVALMAIAGHDDSAMQKQAYNQGIDACQLKHIEQLRFDSFSYRDCREALYDIKRTTPMAKQTMMKALAAAALADDQVTLEEYELLRTLGMALDCPIPPHVALN